MCNFCEDKGDSLVCQVRGWNGYYNKWAKVPIYPRDLLGELYRGEFRDTFARPMWASVELKKDALADVKLLPDYMVGIGPAQKVLKVPKLTKPPLWVNPFAAGADVTGFLLTTLCAGSAGGTGCTFLRRPNRRRPPWHGASPRTLAPSKLAMAHDFL